MSANYWTSSQYEQWTFDKGELQRLRAEDLKIYTEEEYSKFMIFWCNFIQNLVTDAANQGHPRIRMQVVATAICFFKRFYLRRSFKDMDPFALACVCVLLGAKAEEHGQVSVTKLGQLVQPVMKKYFNANYELKSPIPYDIEFIMVETMDCCLIMFHPWRPLAAFLADLRKEPVTKLDSRDIDELDIQAWKVVNDTFRTDCHFIYPPHIIALASILVAASLMDKDHALKGWLPELSIDMDQVFDCVCTITDMYTLWKDFVEKEQVQGLVDKLPKVNGDPSPSWGRPSSAMDRSPNQNQPTSTGNNFFMSFPSQTTSNMEPTGSGNNSVVTSTPSAVGGTAAFGRNYAGPSQTNNYPPYGFSSS